MTENPIPPSNVTQADFMQKALKQVQANGASQKIDTTTAIANLALSIVEIQKAQTSMNSFFQQVDNAFGQLSNAHNALVKILQEKQILPVEPPKVTEAPVKTECCNS